MTAISMPTMFHGAPAANTKSAGPAAPQPVAPAPRQPASGLAAKVMIVDDEPVNIKVVRKYLQIAGYENFVTLTDSTVALDTVRREQPDVVLLDVMMPGTSGLDILAAIRADEQLCHLPALILTASTDAKTKLRALELGATDFLAKPVDPNELMPRVRNALVVKAHHDHLADASQRLERQVRARTAELEASHLQLIHCLARAAEYRDDATGRHVARVGRYAAAVARSMGTGDEFAHMIMLAAQLHDVGKIGISDLLLLKPGKLTPEEYKTMQQHCVFGQKIIAPALDAAVAAAAAVYGPGAEPSRPSPLLVMAANIAATHHERWDGTGYPQGLRGEAIPIEGRIAAVADVYDALSSERPYKPPMPLDKCLSIINDGRGTHFDPAVVEAFMRSVPVIVSIQNELAEAA